MTAHETSAGRTAVCSRTARCVGLPVFVDQMAECVVIAHEPVSVEVCVPAEVNDMSAVMEGVWGVVIIATPP